MRTSLVYYFPKPGLATGSFLEAGIGKGVSLMKGQIESDLP
jgi:hypothetical protein